MIKEIKVLKEETIRHKFCDVCGVKLKFGLVCNNTYCQYCKKDLCEKCIEHEENTGGDYRSVYCKKCWEIGNDYRWIIDQFENWTHKLYEEWQNKCKQ